MKKRILSILLCVALVLTSVFVNMSVLASSDTYDVWDGSAVSTSIEGAGTEQDPYLIKSAADLLYVSAQANAEESTYFEGKYIKLTTNINLAGNEFPMLPAFKGTFDGNGYEIKGLYIYKPDSENVAFFGKLKGTVKNLTLTGSVTGKKYVSGYATATEDGSASIINCVNNVNLTAVEVAAGFISTIRNSAVTIEKCVNNGKIEATTTSSRAVVGGLIGYAGGTSTVTVTVSQNNGTLTATRHDAGGIIAKVGGTSKLDISYCVNAGNITAGTSAGGILGYNEGGNNAKVTMNKCVNYGKVSSNRPADSSTAIGAIVGSYGNGFIANTDATATYYCSEDVDLGVAPDYQVGYESSIVGTAKDKADFTNGTILALLNEGETEEKFIEGKDKYPVLNIVASDEEDKDEGNSDETVLVNYTFENHPGTVEQYNTDPALYNKDGFLANGDSIISYLLNYGGWTGSTDLTPKAEYANNSNYGVGYSARIGAAVTRLNVDINPDKFYKISVDAKVIDVEPEITVQIGLFRSSGTGEMAFRDELGNTYDTAIKTISLTLDELTDYKTYSVELSGAEILAFCSSYETNRLYIGAFCSTGILKESYRNKFGLALDNFKAVETEIPEGYVPAADLPGTDILERNLTASFGENLYNVFGNGSFEEEISSDWTLSDGATIKTANGDSIYGDKYLNLDAKDGAQKVVIPFKLTVNKTYTLGISTRAAADAEYRVFVSSAPYGTPLADIDFAEQELLITPKGEDGSIKRQGIKFRCTMKSEAQQYLIIEVANGSVDFDEITLTDKDVTDINKNYYEQKGTYIVNVYDMETLNSKKIEVPYGKTVYDVVK